MTTTGDATRLPDSIEQDLAGPLTGESEEGRSRLSGKSVSAFRTISEVSAELDVPQGMPAQAAEIRTAVFNAMEGHLLGKALLVARFHR